MLRKIAAFLLLLPLFLHPLQAGVWDQIKSVFSKSPKTRVPTIKVLVAHDLEEIKLKVEGKHYIYDPYTKEHLSTHYYGKEAYIRALPSGIKWGEEFPGVYQVKIIPDSDDGTVWLDGVEYKGSIVVYDIGESISVVNEVDIEEYVRSVLCTQLENPLPNEALAAVVIATRTQAYHQAFSASNPYWTVDAHQFGYHGGISRPKIPGLLETINATRFMILSKTGIYERILTPLPVVMIFDASKPRGKKQQRFVVDVARDLALKGFNAARILTQAFPNTSIQLTFDPQSYNYGESKLMVDQNASSKKQGQENI
ncbi:MAG: SpoIID/LytB domain-containing protein [Chlamydiales bacterium]